MSEEDSGLVETDFNRNFASTDVDDHSYDALNEQQRLIKLKDDLYKENTNYLNTHKEVNIDGVMYNWFFILCYVQTRERHPNPI